MVITVRKSPVFPLAALVAATEPLPLVLPPDRFLTDQTSGPVEARMAAAAAEGAVQVVGGLKKLSAAIPALVT